MNKYTSILKIAPKQVENTKGLCICDKCKNTFKPEETLMENVIILIFKEC